MKMLIVTITMRTSLHALLLIVCTSFIYAFDDIKCGKIYPDSISKIPVELGKEFTATCVLQQNGTYSAEDIEWSFEQVKIPQKYYRTINNTVVSVTVNVSESMKNPLLCKAYKKHSNNLDRCTYGIYLDKGYRPSKPENLSCIARQHGREISPNLTCFWDPGRMPRIATNYTLTASVFNKIYSNSSNIWPTNSLTVRSVAFPHHVSVTVKVEAKNALGTALNELEVEAENFVKPNPPSNVSIIKEDNFPRSLMINWTHPFHSTIFKVRYHIRYCVKGSSEWKEVSENATKAYVESFRLQSLEPCTDYVVQIRCIHRNNLGYWSDWSPNATARTPEAKPGSKPDLWRIYEKDNMDVKLIWKDPVKSNGKILAYDITITWKSGITEKLNVTSRVHMFNLKEDWAHIRVTAKNSVGVSPSASLTVLKPNLISRPGVKQVNCSVRNGQLWVEWQPPEGQVNEYLLEWVSVQDNMTDWQRVHRDMTYASLKGNIEWFKRYIISVYAMYRLSNGSNLPGKQVTQEAYLKQGPPLKGPLVEVVTTQKNSVFLKWNEVPVSSLQGFVTNYTVFYKTEDKEQYVVVGPEVYTYKLTGLISKSHYTVNVMVSNVEGSVNGSHSSLYTKKYDDGEVEIIVVLVCLGFLFVVLFSLMFSLKNRELIKKRLWPQVPDPSHSTLANWSPDCPVRTVSPKEATLPDVSVVEVDVFDGKSLSEEDKAMLPLRKDKYFSEEHSSGIGGSSCMSSPRQSVSDSDEGDSGQTTASTVQYSSVVASGYKGQTPGLQGHVFARSESTQPLLDCEEHPEHLMEGSSHQRNSYFRRGQGLEQLPTPEGEEPTCSSLSFSPMEEEDTPTLTEDPPGPAPGYMPQQSGYRPQ